MSDIQTTTRQDQDQDKIGLDFTWHLTYFFLQSCAYHAVALRSVALRSVAFVYTYTCILLLSILLVAIPPSIPPCPQIP